MSCKQRPLGTANPGIGERRGGVQGVACYTCTGKTKIHGVSSSSYMVEGRWPCDYSCALLNVWNKKRGFQCNHSPLSVSRQKWAPIIAAMVVFLGMLTFYILQFLESRVTVLVLFILLHLHPPPAAFPLFTLLAFSLAEESF